MSHQVLQSNVKLLVVDDDRSIRALVSKIATDWGYDTEECDGAESALQRLERSKFNIVLTDIKMGKMDGLAFAEKIRATMPSTAVVIMTGFPSSNSAKKSHDLGAIYYMQKPIDKDDLGNTLKIATAWNIGMLTDRASRRFLALRKGHERDKENRTKAVKYAIKKLLASPGWMEHLRNFVYAHNVESNPLYAELNQRFSAGSINHF